MRELELSISDALKVGISPYKLPPFGTETLKECLGFRCGKSGLERYKPTYSNLPELIPIITSWPFPQFMTHEKYNLLVVRDVFASADLVYSVSSDYTTFSLIATITTIETSPPNMVEVSDFGLFSFFTNGVTSYYYNPDTMAWQEVLFPNPCVPLFRTICNFKGQAFAGNVVNEWYDCDERYYLWTDIGDFKFNLDMKNEAGYRRDPYGGVVWNVRRLGDAVIGYSTGGVSAFIPAVDPAPTFGVKELLNVGILNQNAVDGDYNKHLYVGQDYDLRIVTEEGIKDLGYGHLFEQLSLPIIVRYDKLTGDFYIGNDSKTYLLSSNGLTEVPQHPSAIWAHESTTYSLPDDIDTYNPLIVSEPLDMGYKGNKTIFTMETDATGVYSPTVSVDFINNLNQWLSTQYKPINNQGIATIIISGNAFRFKLKFGSLTDDFRIGYIKSRYKMTDLRGIRGVYAPPLRGQNAN